MKHQPNDNNNHPNRPQSYGDFNHRKIDKINRCPLYGDIDHQTYYDKKTHHSSQDYNQFDEYTHPNYGHINDQNPDENNCLSRIPAKYLRPSDFTPRQYTPRQNDPPIQVFIILDQQKKHMKLIVYLKDLYFLVPYIPPINIIITIYYFFNDG